MPPGKVSNLLTDHLITDKPLKSEPAQEKPSIHINRIGFQGGYIYEAHFECHDILMLPGKSPIKWRQRPDMTLAVDWDVKYQFKQTILRIKTLVINILVMLGWAVYYPVKLDFVLLKGTISIPDAHRFKFLLPLNKSFLNNQIIIHGGNSMCHHIFVY